MTLLQESKATTKTSRKMAHCIEIARKKQRPVNRRNKPPQAFLFRRVSLTLRRNPKSWILGEAEPGNLCPESRKNTKDRTCCYFYLFMTSQVSHSACFNCKIETVATSMVQVIKKIMLIPNSRHFCRVLLEHGHGDDHSLTMAAFSCKD